MITFAHYDYLMIILKAFFLIIERNIFNELNQIHINWIIKTLMAKKSLIS